MQRILVVDEKEKSFLKKIIPVSAFIGGLCCFTPVVLVLFGLGTVAYGVSLANVFYGTYKWAFRGAALLFLFAGLFWYIYKKEEICTLDKLRKNKRKVVNLILITLIFGIIAYIIWLYVIVELIGIAMGLW
ncbi:MAG: hypothetical protein ISS25_03135 [Nanoarchaeota archaeon]|nr:hypothetical protein [DPANN group archaeon]MBL7116795.1 hypothetical protein [Nanoarchaeota archaeon]